VKLLMNICYVNALKSTYGRSQLFTLSVQNILIDIVAEMLAARLEGCFIKSHKFNQLGGLRLEREIRMLVAHFSNHDHCSAREVFSRLIQIATILNLETVHEIVEFWGDNSGAISWRLNSTEVKTILALRSDFKQEAIKSLHL